MSGYPPYPARLPGRPLGVTILAALVGVFGFFILLAGVIFLALVVGLSLVGAHGLGFAVFGTTGAVAGVALIVLGIIMVALAVGLWRLEMWALALSIVVFIVLAVGEYISGSTLGLILAVILVVYLAAVHRHFR